MDIVFTVVVDLSAVVLLLIGRRNATVGYLSFDGSIRLAVVADGLEKRAAASARALSQHVKLPARRKVPPTFNPNTVLGLIFC